MLVDRGYGKNVLRSFDELHGYVNQALKAKALGAEFFVPLTLDNLDYVNNNQVVH